MSLTHGAWVTQAIYVAAQLGIADHLTSGPRSADDLGHALNADPASLYRLLRALATVGVFTETPERRFALTPLAEFLRADHPMSGRNLALLRGMPETYGAWGELLRSVGTGQPVFEQVFGKSRFEYFAADENKGRIYNNYMDDKTRRLAAAVVESYDFSPLACLIDVGGGHGRMLGTVLQAHDHIEGVLLDLPSVVRDAGPVLETLGVAGRVRIMAGDFFASVPDGDGYLLCNVLHDWDDERARQILANVVRAMAPGGRVLVLERLVTSHDRGLSSAPWFDLHMLVTLGGGERTREEFCSLYAAAGLRLNRIIETATPICVMECFRESSRDE